MVDMASSTPSIFSTAAAALNATMAFSSPSLLTPTTTVHPINVSTTPWSPIDPPDNKCNYFVKNETVIIFDFSNQYGGIPQNLVFNLIGWTILVVLFAILRRGAGNYGRLALVRKDDDESKWTQLFFAPDEVPPSNSQLEDEELMSAEPDSLASVDYNDVDNGVCSWVASIFTLSDDQFLRKCGMDAVQYLKFQRHLIIFVLIMTVVCVGIILPVNFQGTIQGTNVDFGHTTISNLSGADDRLWIHIAMTILFFPLGVFLMRKFSVNLRIDEQSVDDECISSRTLMVVGVPDTYCTKDFLVRHFHEAYPGFEVDDVQIAYDVSRLSTLDERRERARRARLYCENYASKHGSGQQMKPFACGIICCCGQSVDALTFYQREEESLGHEVEREKARIKTKSIGIAFITFAELRDAKQVNRDHRARCRCLSDPPTSSLSSLLEPHHWSIRFAPPPDDIYWENLNDTHRLFFIKALLINVVVFVVLFFFTSPAYIISQIEIIMNFKNFTPSDKVNDFIPTLMLWTLSALLPIIVAYSDWWMGHWRRSVENLWIMRKVFFYLLFMVLILPSIGLTTLRAVFEFLIHSGSSSHDQNLMKWNCIFLPDNGAFFVNYVITSALVGTALELMRFSELFMYTVRMVFARSVAETPSVRKANLYEFPFGFNYGWMLLIFALTAAYAVVCPLITPFGLFYLIMKHGVDRYNIYYAYKRSKINKNIHATAVNCVIVSLLIQQLVLLFFNIVRSQDTSSNVLSARAIFSLSLLVIFTVLFLAQMFFHVFKGISPLQYVQMPTHQAETNGVGQHNGGVDEDESPTHQSGGASGDTLRVPQQPRRRKRNNKQFVPDVLRSRDVFSAGNSLSRSGGSSVPTFAADPSSSGVGITRQPVAYGSTDDSLLVGVDNSA